MSRYKGTLGSSLERNMGPENLCEYTETQPEYGSECTDGSRYVVKIVMLIFSLVLVPRLTIAIANGNACEDAQP